MKKFTGRYTNEASKALKGSKKILCHVADQDDGTGNIYVTNGYFLWKLNAQEYAAVVQPVTCCEPGAWTIDSNGKQDNSMDLAKLFADTLQTVSACAPMERAPLTLHTSSAPAACYYSTADDFAAIYNEKYIAALATNELRAVRSISPAVAYFGGDPFALVFPIKPGENDTRAIRAYFTHPSETDKLRAELAQAQEEAAALRGDLYRAANEIDELKTKLAELHETKPEQPAEQKPEPKTAAEIIAARLDALDGVTTTIKGAQTATPVIWITGDTDRHADALTAAGAKWSNKKAAYYVRVA
mgnify:CR=1 FL=1